MSLRFCGLEFCSCGPLGQSSELLCNISQRPVSDLFAQLVTFYVASILLPLFPLQQWNIPNAENDFAEVAAYTWNCCTCAETSCVNLNILSLAQIRPPPSALISVLKALWMSQYASDKCALNCLFCIFVASQLHQKSPTDRMSGLLWCWIGLRSAEVAWNSSHRVKINGFMNQLWLLNTIKQYKETNRCLC